MLLRVYFVWRLPADGYVLASGLCDDLEHLVGLGLNFRVGARYSGIPLPVLVVKVSPGTFPAHVRGNPKQIVDIHDFTHLKGEDFLHHRADSGRVNFEPACQLLQHGHFLGGH